MFDGGLITYADPEDIEISAATVSINFETDVPGKLIKRSGRGDQSTMTGNHVDQIVKWSHQDLAAPVWVFFEPQENKIKECAADFTSISTIKDLSTGTPATTIEINNYGRQIRFANGLNKKAGIYQKIDREFFFGNYTVDSFIYDDATLLLPTTWDMEVVTDAGDGMRQSGFYNYKFVPVYDGVQEHPLPEASSSFELTSDDKTLKVGLKLDKSGDFNPRITSIKLYRSFSDTATGNLDPVYYHIFTIPVKSKADHEDVIGSAVSVRSLGTGYFYHSKLTNSDSFGGHWGDDEWDLIISQGGNTHEIDHDGTSFPSSGLFALVNGNYNWTNAEKGFDKVSNTYWQFDEHTTNDGNQFQSSGFSAGKDVLYKSSWDYRSGEADGSVIYKTSGPAIEEVVVNSKNKVVRVSNDITQTGTFTIDITDGYRYEISGDDVTLWFYDMHYNDRALHPLGRKKKVTVNHKYSVHLAGRQFVGNVRLDPGGDDEDHDDWVIYSSLQQLDILPIVNYIQIKDLQGGEITGLTNHLGSLVVFMERGIYRLDVPTIDPSRFSLVESEENIGCIAPNSIVTVAGQTFFAGQDNAYVIDPGFNINPITEPIKDIYQASADLEDSRFFYDPKKARILCRFGSDIRNIYCFDMVKARQGKAVWYQFDLGAIHGADIFAIDQDMNIFSITNTQSGTP